MSAAVSTRVAVIVQRVVDEFGEKAELFTPVVARMDSRDVSEFDATKKPGVYVFLHEKLGCLKVGKSFSNASKRALQHCGKDNTCSNDGRIQMAEFLENDKTYLLVFALQKPNSLHWVLALEYFLEDTENPAIPSRRNG